MGRACRRRKRIGLMRRFSNRSLIMKLFAVLIFFIIFFLLFLAWIVCFHTSEKRGIFGL